MEIITGTETKQIVDFKEPFLKDKFNGLSLFVSKDFFSGGFSIRGSVQFANGNTNGEQKFKGGSIEDVLSQMKTFLDSLK